MTEVGRTLAVDLGGTRMRAAVVMPDGEVCSRRAIATPQDAACPDALMELAGDVLAAADVGEAVIGVPGRVDHRHGRLEHAPNLPPHWPGALDERLLAERFGLPVSLANDADLAAVGEAYFGAARAYTDVVYLTVSTGVGAGVLLDRRLVAGARSLAEVGHTVIDRTAGLGGQHATFETLGSGTALERLAGDAGLPADGARIVELVHAGDPHATRVWDEVVAVIATGVANLAFLFTPEVIVLGGGVGRNGDLLVPVLRAHLDSNGPPGLPVPIEVVVAELGDDAGLVGAGAWRRATRKPGDG
ncbi:MAG: ROK family protein [Egibacteraceae bacterium]